jgi:hypothetical protein
MLNFRWQHNLAQVYLRALPVPFGPPVEILEIECRTNIEQTEDYPIAL